MRGGSGALCSRSFAAVLSALPWMTPTGNDVRRSLVRFLGFWCASSAALFPDGRIWGWDWDGGIFFSFSIRRWRVAQKTDRYQTFVDLAGVLQGRLDALEAGARGLNVLSTTCHLTSGRLALREMKWNGKSHSIWTWNLLWFLSECVAVDVVVLWRALGLEMFHAYLPGRKVCLRHATLYRASLVPDRTSFVVPP